MQIWLTQKYLSERTDFAKVCIECQLYYNTCQWARHQNKRLPRVKPQA